MAGWPGLCAAVEPGGELTRVRQLGGGLGGATQAVDIRSRSGEIRRLVVKQPSSGTVGVANEWRVLQFVAPIDAPTPQPVALDVDGTWFGRPSLVMTRLAGRPYVNGIAADGVLRQIAAVLARIHATPLHGEVRRSIGPQPAHFWAEPKRPAASALLRQAHAAIAHACAIETDAVFIHGDFFAGNLLWSRGNLSGVVDWSAAGEGPRAYDLANCRTDLVLLSGSRPAERILEFYVTQSGACPANQPLWDLYCSLIALQHFRHWREPYQEQELQGWDDRRIRSRLMAYVARSLTRLGGLVGRV